MMKAIFLALAMAFAATAHTQTALPLPAAYPNLLGASCGGVHVSSFVTGFDDAGNITGETYAWTSCSTGGRGTKPRKIEGWRSITWTLTGNYKVATVTDIVVPDPDFTATDAYGNFIRNVCNGTTGGQPLCVATATISYLPPGTPPPDVTVPSIVAKGLTGLQVQSLLEGLGLVYVKQDYCTPYYARGMAVNITSPASGSVVPVGTPVTVLVSSGPCDE